MALPIPSKQELLDRVISKFRAQTSFNVDLNSSVVGILFNLFAEEMENVWDYIKDLAEQSNLSTASGASLDQFGLFIGVPRKKEVAATTVGQTRAVKFTNLGNVTVNIIAGTRVWTSANTGVAFFTSEGVVIPAGTSAFVHVTAADSGVLYNVGIGQINAHNAPFTTVNVTNVLPIQNGSELESDDSYRERILQGFRQRNVLNVDTTIALLRSVDGVKDVLIQNLSRGSGTFDAIIVPFHETQASQTLDLAQQLLDLNMPVGVNGVVKLPVNRLLDVKLTLVFKSNASNKEAVRQIIKNQITSRVSALSVSSGTDAESLFLTQFKALAIGADDSVIDAALVVSLDDRVLSPEGQLTPNAGERIVLRNLIVQ